MLPISKFSALIKNSNSRQFSRAIVFGSVSLALAALLALASPLATAQQQVLKPDAAQNAVARETQAVENPGAPAAKSQEEQNNAFRLEGPIVKWTARTLNVSTESAARIYEFTNFIVILLLVGIPIVRILPKVFHKRSETLGASLKEARTATQEANARLSAVEAKLAGLDDEIKKLHAEVEQQSKDDEIRIKASIEEERTRIVQAAEQELTVAAAQAQRALRHFAADLAIEQAAKQLVLTPEADRALIAEFIASTSSIGNGKGGQN
jgi:F-type H+-transporting ATPase subunit b